MTTTDAAALTPKQIVERNMAVVDAHFHNENPEDIDKAIDLYGETIVWEVPARGVLLRDKAEVKQAYLKLFDSYQVTKMIQINRFGTGNFVVDDSVAEMTLVGDVENNVPGCPFPAGNGKIIRENGYELWRRQDGPIDDDIPADAVVIDF